MASCVFTPEQLAHALGGAEQRGADWWALCPAHDDKNPSLHITPAEGGCVFNCHAGCDKKTTFIAVKAAAPDGFPEKRGRPPAQNKPFTIIAEYDYTDEQGVLLGQVVRLEPKSFRQRRPLPGGKWSWKMDGLQLPLFHLPKIAKETSVFIVEGEKDVLAMEAIGLPATCNPGGAGKWREHHSAALAGIRICIIADKDIAGRSHAYKVAQALLPHCPTVRIIEAPDPHKDPADWIEGGATSGLIGAMARDALQFTDDEPPPQTPDDEPPKHATAIHIINGELPRMVDEAEAAIMAQPNHAGLYQRGGWIVRVVRLEKAQEGIITKAAGTPIIQPVTQPALLETLNRVAHWLKWDGNAKDWRPRDAPRAVADFYGARVGFWDLRPLSGVTDMPTLRFDGTILQEHGYDLTTGLVLLPHNCPEIPDSSTREDADKALNVLWEPIKDFPFATVVSRSVAFAAILTVCIRHALPFAPMFLFDAPERATGKSLLCDVISIIGTGSTAPALSQATNAEEDAKRMLAILMQGTLLVCIDNVERVLEGDALCSILTQTTYGGRVLGGLTMATVPTATTFLASGNNISVRGDLARRVMLCRLDAGMEFPEQRQFDGDLRVKVRENRAKYVAAALTILRAFHVAGKPKQSIPSYGVFEVWSDWIRSALVWLGEPDPNENRERVKTGDETARQLGTLLAAWHERFSDNPRTVQQALHEPPENILEVILDIAGDQHNGINNRKFGKWLARAEGRIIEGMRFESGPSFGTKRTWKAISLMPN